MVRNPSAFTSADGVSSCNVANGPIAWIPRLFGKPAVFDVDGLDRNRKKWNFLGRWSLYFANCSLPSRPHESSVPRRLKRQSENVFGDRGDVGKSPFLIIWCGKSERQESVQCLPTDITKQKVFMAPASQTTSPLKLRPHLGAGGGVVPMPRDLLR